MRTDIFKWAGIFLLCFVLQTTVVPLIGVSGIIPDLLLTALFFLALRNGQMAAVGTGFFLGLAQDLFSAPSILGQNALSKTIAGFFAGFFNKRMMRVDVVFQIVLLFVMFLVNDAVYFMVQAVKTDGGGVMHNLVATSVPRALYSMVFALLPYIKHHFFPTRFRR
jgi:rod shape-determining protein MreD